MAGDRPPRGRAIARIALATLVVLVFGAAGTAVGVFVFGSKVIREGLGIIFRDPARAYTVERQFQGVQALNVLVLGVDRDMDRYRSILKTNGRSDSIMIARVDFAERTIKALTIPRDTAVRIPGRRGIHKINAAHAFGGPVQIGRAHV